jgi:hypothetical protein
MVLCIECDHLFIREEEATTYFCLKNRDYLVDIDEIIMCTGYKRQQKRHSR